MTESASLTAISLLALMKLQGVGRVKALRIIDRAVTEETARGLPRCSGYRLGCRDSSSHRVPRTGRSLEEERGSARTGPGDGGASDIVPRRRVSFAPAKGTRPTCSPVREGKRRGASLRDELGGRGHMGTDVVRQGSGTAIRSGGCGGGICGCEWPRPGMRRSRARGVSRSSGYGGRGAGTRARQSLSGNEPRAGGPASRPGWLPGERVPGGHRADTFRLRGA